MPLKSSFSADGQLDGDGVGAQTVVHHVQHVEEIRAGDVHLVDVDHPGDMIVIGLTPHSLGLGLNTALGAEDGSQSRPARAGNVPPQR